MAVLVSAGYILTWMSYPPVLDQFLSFFYHVTQVS